MYSTSSCSIILLVSSLSVWVTKVSLVKKEIIVGSIGHGCDTVDTSGNTTWLNVSM